MVRFLCLLLVLAGVFIAHGDRALSQTEQSAIRSTAVDKIPLKDINNTVWEKTQGTKIDLFPQNMVPPVIHESSTKYINVKSLNDGKWIAFLLEWEDEKKDSVVDVDIFSDQVAIQLPHNPASLPSFMMGNKDGRVHIMHWKAIWQDDIEKGYTDVQTLHPNYWVDLYFSDGKTVLPTGAGLEEPRIEDFDSPAALNYMPAMYVGNPVSILDRKQPVEEAIAEGFGTFTTQPEQNAVGWGRWEDGKWKVLIARPVASGDPNDAPIGDKTYAGFAVWDGSAKNVGSRKHYSQWVEILVEK